jgi:hypothetical protein
VDAALWLAGGTPTWQVERAVARPASSLLLRASREDGTTVHVGHLAAPEPGIFGSWSILGEEFEVGFWASYVPSRAGWCVAPPRAFHDGAWRELAPGVEPQPGRREPWAEAHVAMARAFLKALGGEPSLPLASLDEGLLVQRVLTAGPRSEEGIGADLRKIPVHR